MGSHERLSDLTVVQFQIQPQRYEGSETVRYLIDSDPMRQLPVFAVMDLDLPRLSSILAAPKFNLVDTHSFTMSKHCEGKFGTTSIVDPNDEHGWVANIDLRTAEARMRTYVRNFDKRAEKDSIVATALRAELAADIVVSLAHIDWMEHNKTNIPRGHKHTRMISYGQKVLNGLMNKKNTYGTVFEKWRNQFKVLPMDSGGGGPTPETPDPTLPSPRTPILTS